MRHSTITILLTILSMTVTAQKLKRHAKDTHSSVSKEQCGFLRQTGRLNVVRSDSLKVTSYKTDSSEMIMYAAHFNGFLTEWNNLEEAGRIYCRLDSLVTLLFRNGLLTSDLLIQAYNLEMNSLNQLEQTKHVAARTVKLLNISLKPLPIDYKNRKKTMLFEVWATFNKYEDGWGSFLMFDLYLISDIEPTTDKLSEYFRRAKIKCLLYNGIQI